MKKITVLTFILLALILAACGGSEAEPTEMPPTEVPPTEAPPAEVPPTEAPASEGAGSPLDSMEHTPDPELINKTWAWESKDPNGNDIPPINVPNPENYTLFFNEDGTFNAELDCNNANGRYATSHVENPQRSIFMELGPTQLAFCGEDSFDQDMANMFGPAQNYTIEENGNLLKFISVAGGPLYYFRNVSDIDLPEPEAGAPSGTVTAPDGVFLRVGPGTDYPYVGAAPFGETGEIIGKSQDGQWWLAAAPNLPGGQVWVSAQYVDAVNVENVPVVAAPSVVPPLTVVPWEWVSTTDPAGVTTVPNPANYIIHFKDDGTADIKADCNNVLASYTTDGSNINITPGPSTMVACGPDSLDSQFMAQLSSAVIYFINGGNLYLDLPADSGTMRFAPQGTPPPAVEQPPAGEAEGSTFYLVSYGPENAPQTLIPGSQITAHFANDQVTGNAGCNNYSAALSTTEGGFAIGPIVTTRKACSEPAGVMEQEQAYLTALESAGAYQWEQSLVNEATLITQGKIFYTLPDGATGVLNFVSSP